MAIDAKKVKEFLINTIFNKGKILTLLLNSEDSFKVEESKDLDSYIIMWDFEIKKKDIETLIVDKKTKIPSKYTKATGQQSGHKKTNS